MRKFFDPDNYLVVVYDRGTVPGTKILTKYTGCFIRTKPVNSKYSVSNKITNLFKEAYYNENNQS